MSIFSRIKNVFSPVSLSYNLVKNQVDFNFMQKTYKNGWLSFFAFMTNTAILSTGIIIGSYFHIYLLCLSFAILFILHAIFSLASWFADDKYFFISTFRDLIFKASKKYEILSCHDEKMKKHIVSQEELTYFIKQTFTRDDSKKKLFAKFLTKKKFKPFTNYELLKFSMKHCQSSNYFRAYVNGVTRDYELQESGLTKKKEEKFSKGLEIIDCLASGKKLNINNKGQIVLTDEKIIEIKTGE